MVKEKKERKDKFTRRIFNNNFQYTIFYEKIVPKCKGGTPPPHQQKMCFHSSSIMIKPYHQI